MKMTTQYTNDNFKYPLKKRCTMKKTIVVIMALSIVALLVGCAKDNPANVQSPLGHPAISGVLYNPNGSVSQNALVCIRKKSVLAQPLESVLAKRASDSLSVSTDNSGKYSFDAVLEPDMYVVEAKNGNNAVLIDSVTVVKKDANVAIATATLEPMGAIKGAVRLSQGGDAQQAFVLAFGIDRFAKVNADGSFHFSGLAEGVYKLRLISSLHDYATLDTGNIGVHAAETTDVKTLDLPYRSILIPLHLNASLDTMSQIATLRWNKLDNTLVKEYKIYRRNIGDNTLDACIGSNPVNDTVFVDDEALQDQLYEYRISAKNLNDQEGGKSEGVRIKIESYLTLDTVFSPMLLPANAPSTEDINDITISPANEIIIPYVFSHVIQVYDSMAQPNRQMGADIWQLQRSAAADEKVFVLQLNTPYTITSTTPDTFSSFQSVLAFNSAGSCIDTILSTAKKNITDIDARDGLLVIAFSADSTGEGNSISLYSLDGTIKRSWEYDRNFYCTRVLAAESNKIIAALWSKEGQMHPKVVIFDSLGNKTSELQIPCGTLSWGIAFDTQRQRLYVSSNCVKQYYFDGMNGSQDQTGVGIIYVYDNDGSIKACYRVINGGAVSAIALNNQGSLLIGSGGTGGADPYPPRIIKLKPVQR
jgi:hypothetical protein